MDVNVVEQARRVHRLRRDRAVVNDSDAGGTVAAWHCRFRQVLSGRGFCFDYLLASIEAVLHYSQKRTVHTGSRLGPVAAPAFRSAT